MARPFLSFPRPAVEPLEVRALMATYPVLTTAADGAWSLRAVLSFAAAGDTIDMTALRGTIPLHEPLVVNRDITIKGPGAGLMTLLCDGRGAAFDVDPGLDVRIDGVTIKNARNPWAGGGAISIEDDPDTDNVVGKLTLSDVVAENNTGVENGGGLFAAACDVTLVRCRFTGNRVEGQTGANGGGVYVGDASLTAVDCTFDNNAVLTDSDTFDTTAMGGGVAIVNGTAASFTNCTFSGNRVTADSPVAKEWIYATAVGGGLGVAMTGGLTLLNCTISNNAAGGRRADALGGGFGVVGFGAYTETNAPTLKIANTVIAGNTGAAAPDAFGLAIDATTGKTNFKNNVIGVADGTGLIVGTNGNRGGTAAGPLDAKLGDLADNGGPVPTMAPRANSPVLGAGSTAESPRRDARGYVRSPSIDAGAVEVQTNYAPGLTVWPADSAAVDVPYSSRMAATDVDGNPIAFTLVTGPAWLKLVDRGDGTATLTGLPTAIDAGPADVLIKAGDGRLTWDEAFTLNVTATPVSLTAAGVLRVIGTDAADAVRVWQPRGPGGGVRVRAFGKTRNYAAGSVKSIQVFGRGGDDVIAVICYDFGAYVQAGDGDDTVVGSERADSITAAAGDDSVMGMGGDDWVDGNSGRDYLNGGNGADRLYGGNGRDVLEGGAGSDVLYGEAGNNVYLIADGERDRVFGTNPLTDLVEASDAKDLLSGAVSSRPPVRR